MTERPFISAVIPCRNEEKYLTECLQSICDSDYPLDRLEVFVVDGMSTDRSREIVREFGQRYPNIHLVDNPKRILAAAWNIGVKRSRGSIVFAMNAHAKVEKTYFDVSLKYMRSHQADCVGPVIVTHPQDETLLGKVIATALSSRFGVGDSRFRTGVEKPTWVDTVHCCAYRRDVFDRIGYYNEELVRSQDIDLHMRLKRAGGKALLVPEMKIHYYTRSNVKGFLKYGFINGYWVSRPYCFGAFMAGVRHMVPMIFVISLLAPLALSVVVPKAAWIAALSLTSYTVAAAAASVSVARRKRDMRFAFLLPLVFFTFHVTYGLGCSFGMLQALFSQRFWKRLLGAPPMEGIHASVAQ